MRICTSCNEEKDDSYFYKREKGKLIAICIPCHNKRTREYYQNNRDKQLARNRNRYKNLGVTARFKRLQKKHGINESELLHIHTEQKDRCAICKQPETIKSVLSLDHCHISGNVRGLLCMRCNLLLGHAKDNIILLREAIGYLQKWKSFNVVK